MIFCEILVANFFISPVREFIDSFLVWYEAWLVSLWARLEVFDVNKYYFGSVRVISTRFFFLTKLFKSFGFLFTVNVFTCGVDMDLVFKSDFAFLPMILI